MSNPAIGVAIPQTVNRLPELEVNPGPFGTFVEELGYESVWASERGSDSFIDLAEVAAKTTEVRVGTAVVNVFTRSPLEIAMSGATLNRTSNGRAILGIGASHPGKVSDLHGLPYSKPITRAKESIELIHRYLNNNNQSFDYNGTLFQMEDLPSRDVDIPIFNGALGEVNRRLTGHLCEGWIPLNIPLPTLAEAYQTVEQAAREAGRDPSEIEVAPMVQVAVDDDPTEARFHIRKYIAEHAGAYEDNTYLSTMSLLFPDEARRISELWRSGHQEQAIESVPDEMIDKMHISGTPEHARSQLRRLTEMAIVDTVILRIPRSVDATMMKRTIIELSPELL